MLHLRKHLATVALTSLRRRALLSTAASATPFSVEDYLVATCGLTRAQALKASKNKNLSNLKSASNPDAVLPLISSVGIPPAAIAAIVAADPLLLLSKADNIARRLADLRDHAGLSDPEIARFLLAGGARALRSCDVAAKLDFWIPFFGSFDELLQAVRCNRRLLSSDLDKVIKPKIALLEQCGLSVRDIAKLTAGSSWLLLFSPERVKEFVLRADKLGVPRSSGAFKYAVSIACSIGADKVAMRMEFLRSTLGCSMEKVRLAVCKLPQILGLSEEKLGRKIEFMVTDVGLEPEYILERPVLFTLSLERRMLPRYLVVKILREKGLMEKGVDFRSLVACSESGFAKKYIDYHKDTVPHLADAYAAACSS